MPLVDVTKEMGTMIYAAGAHREGRLLEVQTSDESEARYREMIAQRDWPVRMTGAMQAGDVAIHSLWTMQDAIIWAGVARVSWLIATIIHSFFLKVQKS
ncbi:MAG: hypothetical protein ABI210_02015 [Abditibacteriaceae bacterium]